MAGNLSNDMRVLIECVKKRPALYLKSLKEYSDPNLKKKLWEEVCLEAVSGWQELEAENKKLISGEVQKKWNNLRTCFSRELKAQRTKTGLMAVKRRKYIYFENLLFLKSCMSERPTKDNIESKDQEEEDSTELKKDKRSSITFIKSQMFERPTESNIGPSDPDNSTELIRPAKQPNQNSQETSDHILKEDLDEDKNFVLSLVPTLKSLTEDEKFQAKIDILQVLRKIKANRINAQTL